MHPGRTKTGLLCGLVSSATFGLIPLFTLPLLAAGVSVATALVYRFAIAAVVMGAILLATRESALISANAFFKIAGLSVFYMFAVLLFFYSFHFLPSGVVATINFLYPVMVMLIMAIFFHERFRWQIVAAVGLAVLGVALLSLGPVGKPAAAVNLDETSRIVWGVVITLLAALCNAIYFVGVQVARLPKINDLVMTFHIMLIGAVFCAANAAVTNSFVWISAPAEIATAVLLALVTAVISNLTLILAIRRTGSTVTAILGVMEPLTAVATGWLVFGEPLTIQLAAGASLIVAAVLLVLLERRK